jgi:hypothetical protein
MKEARSAMEFPQKAQNTQRAQGDLKSEPPERMGITGEDMRLARRQGDAEKIWKGSSMKASGYSPGASMLRNKTPFRFNRSYAYARRSGGEDSTFEA